MNRADASTECCCSVRTASSGTTFCVHTGNPGGPSICCRWRATSWTVAEPGAVERVLGGLDFDAAVNCAACTRVDEVEDNATLAFAVNAHAVAAMAQVCAAKRARLVHISTDYVFGGDVERVSPLREDDPTAPVNVYGASKAMGETLARLASDDVVILRVASLFGVAGASGKGGNFVETMIRAGREKGALRVVDDQTMSPTATADVARVIVRMLTDGCAPGLYHAVNAGSATWFEFACEIIRRAGVEATVTPCATGEYPVRARASALQRARQREGLGLPSAPCRRGRTRWIATSTPRDTWSDSPDASAEVLRVYLGR